RRPALAFGLPLLAGLAVAHAFIPPTPGPIAIAELIGADLALVILFGAAIGLPSMIIAGPLYTALLERTGRLPDREMALAPLDPAAAPGSALAPAGAAWRTAAIIVAPLALILVGTLAT